MIENQNQPDMFNANDWYETANVFKSKRNLFFSMIFICLLLLQAAFWANNMGWVNMDGCSSKGGACSCLGNCDAGMKGCVPKSGTDSCVNNCDELDEPLFASEAPATDAVGSLAESVSDAEGALADIKDELEQTAANVTGQPIATTSEDDPLRAIQDQMLKDEGESKSFVDKIFNTFKEKPSCKLVTSAVKVCNFILIIAATLYCLTLLMAIKVSLCGRLGGLAHITGAFFASLFMLVLIMPWQKLFPGVVLGMIFTPAELLAHTGAYAETCKDQGRLVGDILYYTRFCGLWLVVVIALFTAQIRSGKWIKAIQQRLGLLR